MGCLGRSLASAGLQLGQQQDNHHIDQKNKMEEMKAVALRNVSTPNFILPHHSIHNRSASTNSRTIEAIAN